MSKKRADVVTFGNFKGGTGKSTTSSLLGYVLSDMGYKVLMVDFDPQGNITNLFMQTKKLAEGKTKIDVIPKTLFTAIKEGDVVGSVVPIKNNLDLMPNNINFSKYPYFLEMKYLNTTIELGIDESIKERTALFSNLLEPLKKDYDFIFIDTPPTMSVIPDSAFYASDYILLILQTQEWSLAGAEKFIPYLNEIIENFEIDLTAIGVLPVILKKNALVDETILEYAKEIFGEINIFSTYVMAMERIKRFHLRGLTNDDMHDKKVMNVYKEIAEEFLERLNQLKLDKESKEV